VTGQVDDAVKNSAPKINREARTELVRAIVRMSQKALGWTLAMVGVGYVGGLITICFDKSLAEPLSRYAEVFVPVFQLEIGVYGLGSTVEQYQKIKTQLDNINAAKNESQCEDAG